MADTHIAGEKKHRKAKGTRTTGTAAIEQRRAKLEKSMAYHSTQLTRLEAELQKLKLRQTEQDMKAFAAFLAKHNITIDEAQALLSPQK